MTDQPDKAQLDDLNLTHAFLNALTSAYQGAFVYENVYGQLSGSPSREENAEDGPGPGQDRGVAERFPQP